jgi:hypothetical protein
MVVTHYAEGYQKSQLDTVVSGRRYIWYFSASANSFCMYYVVMNKFVGYSLDLNLG